MMSSSSHLGLLLTTELAALYICFWDHDLSASVDAARPPARVPVRRGRPPPGPPPLMIAVKLRWGRRKAAADDDNGRPPAPGPGAY